jgi:hypothetical protein
MSQKLLTIGMSTYDDFDGVYFSIQALRMYHEICSTDDVEIVVIDNNPSGPHGQKVKSFVSNWVKQKYIPYEDKKSTSVRNEIFKNSSGKYTICMDCHVLFSKGAINNLLKYYSDNPDCKNIVSGPLVYDDLTNLSSEFSPVWRDSMYGIWHTSKENLEANIPFEINMMGLGAFSCETKYWPGFNENFKGFGGEEGYIHEKFRINGGKAICLPDFKWVHRFGRPNGVKYPLILEDRVWNYFVGWLEITNDPNHKVILEAYDHFKNKLPLNSIDDILYKAKKLYNLN